MSWFRSALLKKIKELERELEKERKLNTEIKARFVKCNTCTPDMKEKCLMFNESLCEGERCEELADLMSLVEKRNSDDKLAKAVELLKFWVNDFYDGFNDSIKYEKRHKALVETEQILKETEK